MKGPRMLQERFWPYGNEGEWVGLWKAPGEPPSPFWLMVDRGEGSRLA